MKPFGIVGHFGEGLNLANGQTIKTKILKEELAKAIDDEVLAVDTHNWRKNPLRLFLHCLKLIGSCHNVIMLPAGNGIKMIVPLLVILNFLFRRRIHYVVIGGWLPNFIMKRKVLLFFVKRINSIHVESQIMIPRLTSLGLKKVNYMPNFKPLQALTDEELVFDHSAPYKLCTFSRVMKEKGIEAAIEAVTQINERLGKTIYTLDIYGAIEEGYKKQFDLKLMESKDYIQYKGVIPFDQSVQVLKSYFVLLFPTYYEGEGFAGTLLDAFASGVPVLASDWKYNREIVKHGINGFVFDSEGDGLLHYLDQMHDKPNSVLELKSKCLQEYRNYSPPYIINQFLEMIGEKAKGNKGKNYVQLDQ